MVSSAAAPTLLSLIHPGGLAAPAHPVASRADGNHFTPCGAPTMTKQNVTDNLVKTKQALSEKYFRLAKI